MRLKGFVKFVTVILMWLGYCSLVKFSGAMETPILTVGGFLMLLGFIGLAIALVIISFAIYS
jgi:hypothetical protein